MRPRDDFPDETAPGRGYPQPGDPVKPRPRSGEHAAPGHDLPAAGPHARPELTDDLKTPGTGVLPPAGSDEGLDSTSG